MAFTFVKAERTQLNPKIELFGPSNSGKSYTALLLARGMVGPTGKIAVINTEANRGEIYATEFDYDILNLEAPYSPERYVEAMQAAVDAGYDVLIVDSASHEWDGEGGILEQNNKMGGKWSNWAKLTPRHNLFVNWFVDSKIPVIMTMRGKDEYLVSENDRGKQTIEKVGMGARQRSGLEYEAHLAFRLDMEHNAHVEKDNTHLFEGQIRKLSTEDGKRVMEWARSGKSIEQAEAEVAERVAKEQEEFVKYQGQIQVMLEKYGEHMDEKQRASCQKRVDATAPSDLGDISEANKNLGEFVARIEEFAAEIDAKQSA